MRVRVAKLPCKLDAALGLIDVHKVSYPHLERQRELFEVERRGVPAPLLDLAKVPDGQAGHRKALLGLPDKPSGLPHVVATVAEKTGTEVAVSTDEKALLASIFGTTLDVGKLKFVAGSPVATGASKTVESTIFFAKKHNVRVAACRRSGAFLSLLAHEAHHAWQVQNVGHAYVANSPFS